MGQLLTNELILPAGGIAGALALIIVTLIKVKANSNIQADNWIKEHMSTLATERKEADERADKYLVELDTERLARIQAESKAARLEGREQLLQEQLHKLEEENAVLRQQQPHQLPPATGI